MVQSSYFCKHRRIVDKCYKSKSAINKCNHICKQERTLYSYVFSASSHRSFILYLLYILQFHSSLLIIIIIILVLIFLFSSWLCISFNHDLPPGPFLPHPGSHLFSIQILIGSWFLSRSRPHPINFISSSSSDSLPTFVRTSPDSHRSSIRPPPILSFKHSTHSYPILIPPPSRLIQILILFRFGSNPYSYPDTEFHSSCDSLPIYY